MREYFKEFCGPTAVDAAISCRFLDADKVSVAVVQSNILSIYSIVSTPAAAGKDQVTLQCDLCCPLQGEISSVVAVKQGRGHADLLVLAFAEAKMATVEYRADTNTLATVSMHYYEHEKNRDTYWKTPSVPEIQVDSQHQCVLMNFYNDRFAILPLRQDSDDFHVDNEHNLDHQEDPSQTTVPPYMPSFVIKASQIDDRIRNVKSFVFLHGYFQPTVAILFEPEQSTAARLSLLRDPMCLAIVSMNVAMHSYSIINFVDRLPYDLFQVIAVPKPIGGVLIVGRNCILHFDQGVRGTGVSVNGFPKTSTVFPLLDESKLLLNMDNAVAAFIRPDKCLISFTSGQLWQLTLHKDGRFVNKFQFNQVAENIGTASCMLSLEPDLLFFGSRLGDSMLIQYRQSNRHMSFKKSRKEVKHGNDADQELDELDFLMAEANPSTTNISSSLEFSQEEPVEIADDFKTADEKSNLFYRVVDRIVSLSPITDMAIGESADFSPKFTHPPIQNKKAMDVVLCTGHKAHSAICVVQQNMRPVLKSNFDFNQSPQAIWSVVCATEYSQSEVSSKNALLDRFVFMSTENDKGEQSTIVLESGQELNELQNSDFIGDSATVHMASMFGGTRVLQVCPNTIRLLNGAAKLVQEFRIDGNFVHSSSGAPMSIPREGEDEYSAEKRYIVQCSTLDTRVVAVLNDGFALTLDCIQGSKLLELVELDSSFKNVHMRGACLFSDKTGVLISGQEFEKQRLDGKRRRSSQGPDKSMNSTKRPTAQFDDDDLYNDGPVDIDGFGDADATNPAVTQLEPALPSPQEYCFIVTYSGSLEIYHLPSWKRMFFASGLEQLPILLTDGAYQSGISVPNLKRDIAEFTVMALGPHLRKCPYLILTSEAGIVTVYQIGSSLKQSDKQRLAICLRKVPHHFLGSLNHSKDETTAVVGIAPLSPAAERNITMEEWPKLRQRYLMPFHSIKGLSKDKNITEGVFLAGKRPAWIHIGTRNQLRFHPMTFDGPVACFTQFNNLNCANGFLYFNADGSMRICGIDERYDHDGQVSLKKVMINEHPPQKKTDEPEQVGLRSVENITYQSVSQKYLVTTYTEMPFIAPEPEEDQDPETGVVKQADENAPEKVPEPYILPQGHILPLDRRYSLELYSPVTWTPVDVLHYGENEQILCVCECALDVKVSGMITRKPFIVVGTAFNKGEDVAMRGRVYIYEIIEVVPEPGRPETNHKIKLWRYEELKGAVSAICKLKGLLCLAIGPKLMIYTFESGEQLIGIAFLDTNLYITSLNSFKSFLLIGDIRKSVWFAAFQTDPAKIVMLGKDFHGCTVMDTGFLVEENELSLLVADAMGNLICLKYAPTNLTSLGGVKLLPQADFYCASRVVRAKRLSDRTSENMAGEPIARHGCILAAENGRLAFVLPINERVFKRLNDVATEMINRLEHAAGLNPRAYRLYRAPKEITSIPVKNFIDGEFLGKFLELPVSDQIRWTRNKGTSNERVIRDLSEIAQALNYF